MGHLDAFNAVYYKRDVIENACSLQKPSLWYIIAINEGLLDLARIKCSRLSTHFLLPENNSFTAYCKVFSAKLVLFFYYAYNIWLLLYYFVYRFRGLFWYSLYWWIIVFSVVFKFCDSSIAIFIFGRNKTMSSISSSRFLFSSFVTEIRQISKWKFGLYDYIERILISHCDCVYLVFVFTFINNLWCFLIFNYRMITEIS